MGSKPSDSHLINSLFPLERATPLALSPQPLRLVNTHTTTLKRLEPFSLPAPRHKQIPTPLHSLLLLISPTPPSLLTIPHGQKINKMPITPVSSPASSFSSTFSTTSSNASASSQNTLYDIVYSQSSANLSKSSDPSRAAATGTNIVPATLAGCRHIARYKHQLKAGCGGPGVRGGTSQDAAENADTAEVDPKFVENLRTLVRYSLTWEGGQRSSAGKVPRGKGTQGTVGIEGEGRAGAAHEVNGAGIKRRKRLDKVGGIG